MNRAIVGLLAIFFASVLAAGDSKVVSVPMLEKDGLIYLRAHIEGQEVFAMLDSGTNHTIVDESLVSKGKCKKATMLGVTGDAQGACKTEADITVYGLPISSQVFVYKLPSGIKALIPVRELSPHGRVTLDFGKSVIEIQR